MNQYLLLRDNKQTGPFTAQELAAKGIKPYDLVWQEGRSAAWRYPSEIEELKAFAPVVEEQPYDRFYKKPGDQAKETSMATNAQTTTEQQPVAQATNAVQQTQPVSEQGEQAAAKHIYVTMPVKGKEEAAKPVAQPTNKNTTESNNKKAAAASYIVSEEDDELNSGMLKGYKSRKQEDDQINNSYMSDYESRKAAYQKNKSVGASTIKQEVVEKPAPKKETWSSVSTPRKKDSFDWKALLANSGRYFQDNKNLTRSLVAAVLILGGVVIGLVINSGHRQPDTQVLESLVKEIRDQRNEKTAANAPETENTQPGSEPQEEKSYSRRTPKNNEEEPAPVQTIPANNTPVQPVTRHAVIKKENSVVTPPQNQNKSIVVSVSNPAPQQQPVETTPAVTEPKEKPINQEVLEKARKNIYEQVRVEASAFKVGLLGGISDLDLTIQNTSLYPLDQVAVEVRYFGMEKKLVKTQTIIFNNVPPGKRRTLEVPSTKRGITIDYSITSINSKALGLAQAGF